MKVVILAGGQQSTLSSGHEGIPKPMAEIGEKPILWHIMKSFAAQGLNDFIICGGYKINVIKEYFSDFYIYHSDITVDLQANTVEIHKKITEDWKVTIVNTGLFSSTGQRVSLIENYVGDEDFIVTYGDCLWNIDMHDLTAYHKNSQKVATLVVTKPRGRNALLPLDAEGNYCSDSVVKNSSERFNREAWINAYTMVFNNKVFGYLAGDYDLEKQLYIKLSEEKQMTTYHHEGFWAAIETARDMNNMEIMWNAGAALWKIWR